MITGRIGRGVTLFSLISIFLLSGCASMFNKITAPCGVTGYVDMPAGTKIVGIALPTDENKTYTIVTPKHGFWISTECMGRLDR